MLITFHSLKLESSFIAWIDHKRSRVPNLQKKNSQFQTKCIKWCKLKNLPLFFSFFLDFGLLSKTVFFVKKWKFMETKFRLKWLIKVPWWRLFSAYFRPFRIEKLILCQKTVKKYPKNGFSNLIFRAIKNIFLDFFMKIRNPRTFVINLSYKRAF